MNYVDPSTVDFPALLESERARLHFELGCAVCHGAWAAGDVQGLARKVFSEADLDSDLASWLLEHAQLPALGISKPAPATRDLPHVRAAGWLTLWRAALGLSRLRKVSFFYALSLLGTWLEGHVAEVGLEAATRDLHPGYPPAPASAAA